MEGLAALGFHMGDTIGLVSIYAQVCHEIGIPPSVPEMVRIFKTSLYLGKDEALDLMRELVGDELFEAMYQEYML
jgi:hypothetical protein